MEEKYQLILNVWSVYVDQVLVAIGGVNLAPGVVQQLSNRSLQCCSQFRGYSY